MKDDDFKTKRQASEAAQDMIALPWSDGVKQTYLQISPMLLQLDLLKSAVFPHLQSPQIIFFDI